MIRKVWIAMCFLAPLGVVAQEVLPKPPAPRIPIIVEPDDAAAFGEIVEVTPLPYKALLIRWYNALVRRQQEQAARAAAAPQAEPHGDHH